MRSIPTVFLSSLIVFIYLYYVPMFKMLSETLQVRDLYLHVSNIIYASNLLIMNTILNFDYG